MTRTQAWDSVWQHLSQAGIPTNQGEAKRAIERGNDRTVVTNLLSEMDRLYGMNLSLEAIQLIGYAIIDAYKLGMEQD